MGLHGVEEVDWMADMVIPLNPPPPWPGATPEDERLLLESWERITKGDAMSKEKSFVKPVYEHAQAVRFLHFERVDDD